MDAQRLELNRLVAAAVVNRRFRQLLLTQPAKAIENGYNGETFSLTPASRQLVCSIVARTLEEFAEPLVKLTGQTDADLDKSTDLH